MMATPFTAAADRLQAHGASLRLGNDQLLKLYALFKVATIGPCNTQRPNLLDFSGRAKWSAWNELGAMDPMSAQTEYIALVDALLPPGRIQQAAPDDAAHGRGSDRGSLSDGGDDDSDSDGGRGGGSGSGAGSGGNVMGVHVSQMGGSREVLRDQDKTVFHWAEEGNTDRVAELLRSGQADVDSRDSQGMTLLHWAADRDYTDLARLLLDSGAQIDVQDDNGQTALHYAAIVESADMVRLLVGRGARPDIADHDGATPAELAPSLMRLPSLE